MRRNAVLLSVVCVGLVGGLALATVLLTTGQMTPVRWYLLGAVHAGVVAVCVQMLYVAFIAQDRHALQHLRGAWGEENTRDELRRAKRKGLIWGWVDSINLKAGDLDHLVVTRRGGLVTIDSKWRTSTDPQHTVDMARDARRAKIRAEGVSKSVLASTRGSRHRARTNPLVVRPVVVLWGAAQHEVPEGAVVDGIEFVSGRRLVAWLAQLDGDPVSKHAGRDALTRFKEFRAGAWDTTASRHAKI